MTTLLDKRMNLTHLDSEVLKKTHIGMAHFAGTAENGKTCADCFYSNKGSLRKGKITCSKYTSLMRLEKGVSFPETASACSHYKVKEQVGA